MLQRQLPISQSKHIFFNSYYNMIKNYELVKHNSIKANKKGVVYTNYKIAQKMVKHIKLTLHESVWEPSGGGGVFIFAILEYLISNYNPSAEELKEYLEKYLFFTDIDKESVSFISNLIKTFMKTHYNVHELKLNGSVMNALTNKKYFDIIIGNPPYINSQNQSNETREFLKINFPSCKKGNADIYYAFIALANKYAKRSIYIVPNSCLSNTSAKNLRESIKDNVSYIRDHKTLKQFKGASTYTSILVLNKKKQ